MASFVEAVSCPRCGRDVSGILVHACEPTLAKVMPRPALSPERAARACRCPEGAEAACVNPDCPRDRP